MNAKIRIKVSNDKMSASLLVGRPNEDYLVTMEEILDAMDKEGIKFGIDTDRIQAAVDNQSFLAEIPCAKGVPSTPGKDGTLKFAVPIKRELKPRIKDDGSADYFDLGLINEIDEGRLLCRRTRPVPGIDGMDIFGNIVPYAPGYYPEFPMGEGTQISSIDDTKLVAANSGYINFENDIISVPKVFKLNSDVNVSTGNIKFRGDIVINGSVREGFCVISGGNITINGAVEGAKIIAAGNVIISQGFTGMSQGSIYSGGNIKCRYMQNMTAKCAGSIETEYALHSILYAQNEIVATSGRGTIAGGITCTCGNVTTKNLGADTYVQTKIIIDDLPQNFWDPNYEPNEEDMINDDSVEIKEEMNIPMSANPQVVAKDRAFPGLRIQIGLRFYELENELKCTKFRLENNDISATPIF